MQLKKKQIGTINCFKYNIRFYSFYRSRKLNTQLENAIQEAMSELDKKEDDKKSTTKISSKESVAQIIVKKTTGRLRSSQT